MFLGADVGGSAGFWGEGRSLGRVAGGLRLLRSAGAVCLFSMQGHRLQTSAGSVVTVLRFEVAGFLEVVSGIS